MKRGLSKWYLHSHVHCSIIHNSQDVKHLSVLINIWIRYTHMRARAHTHTYTHTHTRILLSHEKEGNPGMCNNMAVVKIKSHLILIFTFIYLLLVAGEDHASESPGPSAGTPQSRWDRGQCQQQCTLWVHTTGKRGYNRARSEMSISRGGIHSSFSPVGVLQPHLSHTH